jgi:hypothetical protein
MGSSRSRQPRPVGFSFRNLSIRQQLPLLICLLLLSLILLFGAVSYYGIRSATLGIGQERLRSLSEQLTSMFQQNARTMLNVNQASANQVNVSGAKEVFQKIMQDTLTSRVELLDTTGNIVSAESRTSPGKFTEHGQKELTVPLSRSIIAAEITTKHPDSNFVGKFYLLGD